jgi:hypothetical protein
MHERRSNQRGKEERTETVNEKEAKEGGRNKE